MRLLTGLYVSQATHVAATLGIADLLRDGPRSSDELAAVTGCHPHALYRLLRALASLGVFQEEAEHRFTLTPVSEYLRTDHPESVGPLAVFLGQPDLWQAWGDLLHSVKTGEYAFGHVHGMSPWEYRVRHPEASVVFDRAMTARSRTEADGVLAAYDFGRFRRVVDVGGGRGAFLAILLARHSHTRGVLLDQPQVVAEADAVLYGAGVADRCQLVAGSFFEEIPAGGDAYIFKRVLVDWDDAQVLAILQTCRRALRQDSRLIVIDFVVAPPNQGADGKLTDLAMLVSPGGQARTREEWAVLFHTTGFHLASISPVGADLCIIEGVPA